VIILGPTGAMAQTSTPPAASSPPLLKPAELDQLVAPIALYPDPLLAQVLMASAYPLDIVQAERWAEANKNLKGDALKAAVDKQPWDDSIKSLVATPDVLAMMSSKLDWTQKLGDAVVAQQADVMDAIQRLRTKAQANNKLQSTKEQKVTVSQVNNRQVIAIEPTDPDMLYVPYYDPGVVYGDWPYPDYPPYYWGAPGYIGAGIIAAGIGFGAGYALGRWTGGRYWGGGVNWNNNNINIGNRPGGGGGGTNWRPSVDHRAGQGVGNRGNGNLNFRGSGGQQVIKPGGGGNRGNAGQNRPANRPSAGTGNRPNAGNRPSGGGQRNKAAQRPSGGNRGNVNRGGGNRGGGNRGGAGVAHRGGAGVAHRGGGGGGAAMRAHGGGGMRGGGGGMRGGGGGMRGGGGGGRGGGGRRSDILLKHDIALLGHLDNGLGFYRFSYNGSDKVYVGVMAQEVQQVMPEAVVRGGDGYLRVYYDKLGVPFESYARWLASGAQVPHGASLQH
jgi:hypothetical protein